MAVKWGKEKFENVELNSDESPELFKAQLFALSGVAPERQKVMFKGAVLKVREKVIWFDLKCVYVVRAQWQYFNITNDHVIQVIQRAYNL